LKIIEQMKDRKIKLEQQRRIIAYLLLIAGTLLVLFSFFIRDDEKQELATWIGFGLLLAAIISRLFKLGFGYKPTREELEEKQFGSTGDDK
jgi:hypothetical protein